MDRIVIICFFLILLMSSCKGKKAYSETMQLECVINSYVETFGDELGKEINIFKTKSWTDSTSLISILSINSKRLSEGEYLYSEYAGKRLFIFQNHFQKEDIQEIKRKQKVMPNNLNWNMVEIKPNENKASLAPPEQFNEVQLIYNEVKGCIENPDLLNHDDFKERIHSKCRLCSY